MENFSDKHVSMEGLVVDGVRSVWLSPELGGGSLERVKIEG